MKTILEASPEYRKLTKKEKKEFCNGCGTKGIGGYLVPDYIWFLNIRECCNIHDYDYKNGKNIADKKKADDRFFNNMKALIGHKTKWEWLKKRRMRIAYAYYYFVKEHGDRAFWKDKNNQP